jgi:membrane-bound lytic murein transglycosylase D
MPGKKFTFWFTPVVYITGIMLIISIVLTIQGFSHEEDPPSGNENASFRYPSFAIPDKLEFAGEQVPLGDYDIRESLDREMLVNGFYHSRTIYMLKKSKRYFSVIEPVLKKYGVPDDFKYLAMVESDLDNVVSPAHAVGVWQLLEGTAREYGLEVNSYVDERYDLEKSTEAACRYILDSYKKYSSWTLAAASYNMGRNNLDEQINRQLTNRYYDLLLNDETARYMFRVLAHKLLTGNPEYFGFHITDTDYYPVIRTREITVDTAIPNIAEFAAKQAVSYKILKQLNPWLRQNSLPDNSKVYKILIPEPGQRSYTSIN